MFSWWMAWKTPFCLKPAMTLQLSKRNGLYHQETGGPCKRGIQNEAQDTYMRPILPILVAIQVAFSGARTSVDHTLFHRGGVLSVTMIS